MKENMSTAEQRRLIPAEYLAIEVASERRHEFYAGEMFAMGGGSYWHNLVKDNLAHSIRNCLADRRCTVLTSDQRVKVDATGLYTYPDVVVFCGQPVFEDDVHYSATNPLVLAEVLSDSTERYDRGVKFGHYRRLPSVEEYLLLAQDRISVERYRRQSTADGGAWILTAVTDPAGAVEIESLGISVPVAEIYADVDFPPAAAQAESPPAERRPG
jgi:Uma2 family endonuclease